MSATFRHLPRRAAQGLLAVGLALTALSAGSPAMAAWSVTGNGNAAAGAAIMPAGSAPAVAVSGNNVTVQWPTATFPNETPVAGYIVRRYNAATGQALSPTYS